ncbi:hypothetical protein AXF42_Ash006278 [Apostasia shenzhenica]|uniref:Myb/SANT-like domain-containing protein n=1 Tax=Apostasia shenzhenica TaxID=1088818 RepID=A0A2I0AYN7_9ASPA|nr:hypothetical protein AXF42_Ash006278 [Apostasia shenzhenica]
MSRPKRGKDVTSTEEGGIQDSGKSRKGWSNIKKDYLLDLLLAAVRNDEVDGIQSISSAVWNSITIQINKKFKSNYNKNQVCEQ